MWIKQSEVRESGVYFDIIIIVLVVFKSSASAGKAEFPVHV